MCQLLLSPCLSDPHHCVLQRPNKYQLHSNNQIQRGRKRGEEPRNGFSPKLSEIFSFLFPLLQIMWWCLKVLIKNYFSLRERLDLFCFLQFIRSPLRGGSGSLFCISKYLVCWQNTAYAKQTLPWVQQWPVFFIYGINGKVTWMGDECMKKR